MKKELSVFCENVRLLREVHGLSKREMAKRLGIGIESLKKLEQGVFPPRLSVEIFCHLRRNFGIRPAEMFRPMERYPNSFGVRTKQ